jgi:hypothetical protein
MILCNGSNRVYMFPRPRPSPVCYCSVSREVCSCMFFIFAAPLLPPYSEVCIS